jgi:transcriptional regulator with XRE-family HTH domain
MQDSKTTVGERIKAARLKAKLTQEKLGRLCHMSADWICSIERGHRRAELGTVMKMCSALKLKLEDVVGNPNRKNHKPAKVRKPNGKD